MALFCFSIPDPLPSSLHHPSPPRRHLNPIITSLLTTIQAMKFSILALTLAAIAGVQAQSTVRGTLPCPESCLHLIDCRRTVWWHRLSFASPRCHGHTLESAHDRRDAMPILDRQQHQRQLQQSLSNRCTTCTRRTFHRRSESHCSFCRSSHGSCCGSIGALSTGPRGFSLFATDGIWSQSRDMSRSIGP